MFDRDLVRSMLVEINQAIDKISYRTAEIENADYFTRSPEGMERLDGVAMLFLAIGESLKNIDKVTSSTLLQKHPEIDWAGVKGFRDIIAHHYFDIDADQVFWICKHNLAPLSATIKKMIEELE
jgi:uncharacterized protein with HEPN domain